MKKALKDLLDPGLLSPQAQATPRPLVKKRKEKTPRMEGRWVLIPSRHLSWAGTMSFLEMPTFVSVES